MIVTIAGAICSGKSTLARALGAALGVPVTGFGDYVRTLAARQGLDASRRTVLQELGQREVEADPHAFLADALAWASHKPGAALVLDGLRHVLILDALQAREAEGLDVERMIFLETPDRIRRVRALARGGNAQDFDGDTHPAEQDLRNRLRDRADAVIAGDQSPEAVLKAALTSVAAWKGSVGPADPKRPCG